MRSSRTESCSRRAAGSRFVCCGTPCASSFKYRCAGAKGVITNHANEHESFHVALKLQCSWHALHLCKLHTPSVSAPSVPRSFQKIFSAPCAARLKPHTERFAFI